MINLDTAQLQTETTGAKIVQKLQEYLLTQVSASETAVLPEDKIQCLLVGVRTTPAILNRSLYRSNLTTMTQKSYSLQACNQLEIATHIEMVAAMLKFDAARLMKAALAGTATKRFTDVIQGAFKGVDPEALRKQLDIDEEEEEEGDEAMEEGIEEPTDNTPTSSTAPVTCSRKRKATTQLETSSSKSTKNKGVCALSDATEVYPSVADKQKGYLHSGVDDKFISDRQSSTGGRAAGYGCEYSTVMK